MHMKIVEYGDDLAIVLDRATADKLDLTTDTQVDGVTDGKTLVITPLRDEARRATFKAIMEEMDREYGSVFQRLAE